MRYIFCADTHIMQDLAKLRRAIPAMGLYPDDFIIHLGDIGLFDKALLWWSSLPCKVIVCLGNHENYGAVRDINESEYMGARGKWLAKNIFAPSLGEIMNIYGKSFWFYPGAFSIDYNLRKKDVSVFAEELHKKALSDLAIKGLILRGGADYIISHDGPASLVNKRLLYNIKNALPESYISMLNAEDKQHAGWALDEIYKSVINFDFWYFGHHHKDFDENNIACLYDRVIVHDRRYNTIKNY